MLVNYYTELITVHFLVDFYFSTFARKFALGGSLREGNFHLCEVEVCEKVKFKKKISPSRLLLQGFARRVFLGQKFGK